LTAQDVREHFSARAERYDRSSHWCGDRDFLRRIIARIGVGPGATVLDVASGTGQVARVLRETGATVVGLDFTEAMLRQGVLRTDRFLTASAEAMPLADDSVDAAIERQGIQFMDDQAAVREMVRVTRPGGRVCLVQLCAFGNDDEREYFEILRLRNPARRNFYRLERLDELLRNAGCREVAVHREHSREDVRIWADNGAIQSEAQRAIEACYRDASEPFRRLHQVHFEGEGTIVDHMLFGIAIGTC